MIALLAAAALLGGGSARHPHVKAAVRVAEHRAGSVSFAVRTPGHHWGWHARRTVPSASVLKAMLLVAYLGDPRVRDRHLRDVDRRLLSPMIRRSDDDAANEVVGFVGPKGINRVARRARMRRFRLELPIWGNSRIDAADQARFFLHIDRRIAPKHRQYGMRLLNTVIPSQRWGVGRVRLPGWTTYFKGGWGSGSGAVDHQVALITKGSKRISVAVLTTNSPSHAYAKRTLRLVFATLLA